MFGCNSAFRFNIVPFVHMVGRPHGGAPTDWSGGTLAAAVEMFVKLARHWLSDTFVRMLGTSGTPSPTRLVTYISFGCRGGRPRPPTIPNYAFRIPN